MEDICSTSNLIAENRIVATTTFTYSGNHAWFMRITTPIAIFCNHNMGGLRGELEVIMLEQLNFEDLLFQHYVSILQTKIV